MAMPMMDMMDAWLAEHRASGKLVDVWSYAGRPGGGGILEVDSHEELDAIMAGFPFNQTSNVSIHALADLDAALANARRVFAAMAAVFTAATTAVLWTQQFISDTLQNFHKPAVVAYGVFQLAFTAWAVIEQRKIRKAAEAKEALKQ